MIKIYRLTSSLLLADILASEYEEAIFAATETLKGLIDTCIDESLIMQGVNQIRNTNLDERKSGPTVIEKICSTIENLLDYRYSAVWDMALQVVSAIFDKLGNLLFVFLLFLVDVLLIFVSCDIDELR